jgi:hypothetical protein
MKTSLAFIFAVLSISMIVCCGNPAEQQTSPLTDQIQITSVIPDSLLVADSLTLFLVNVNYEINSTDSATLSIGFNSSNPNSFSMIPYADTTIVKGKGTHTFSAMIAPKKWASGIPFIVYVNIAKAPKLSMYIPLASDTKKIYSFR